MLTLLLQKQQPSLSISLTSCCCCGVPRPALAWPACRNIALSGMTHDIHADVQQDESIMAMHADAERFDPRTEEVFKILQVC